MWTLHPTSTSWPELEPASWERAGWSALVRSRGSLRAGEGSSSPHHLHLPPSFAPLSPPAFLHPKCHRTDVFNPWSMYPWSVKGWDCGRGRALKRRTKMVLKCAVSGRGVVCSPQSFKTSMTPKDKEMLSWELWARLSGLCPHLHYRNKSRVALMVEMRGGSHMTLTARNLRPAPC